MLKTIEATIKKHYNTDKNSSGSNDSTDSGKRRKAVDDFAESTAKTKKRVVQQNKSSNVNSDHKEPSYYEQLLDDDLDFDDSMYDFDINGSNSNVNGRVLPSSWSTPGNRAHGQVGDAFQGYGFKG